MRRSDDFSDAVRRGVRSGTRRLVVHLDTGPAETEPASGRPTTTLVGFVVPRAVGDAVTRNRVKRRVRHLMRDRLGSVPPGSRLVVRCLAPSAGATSGELGIDLDSAIERAGRRGTRQGRRR